MNLSRVLFMVDFVCTILALMQDFSFISCPLFSIEVNFIFKPSFTCDWRVSYKFMSPTHFLQLQLDSWCFSFSPLHGPCFLPYTAPSGNILQQLQEQ